MPIPKCVFLDTEVFDGEIYDFDSPRFKRLLNLVNDGLVKVVSTEITRREVLAHVRETTVIAFQKLKAKDRELKILRLFSPKFSVVFDKHNVEPFVKELEERFAKLCIDLKMVTLPVEGVDLNSIVSDYFELRPPFREGRKRSEFPDAIAAALLKNWAGVARQMIIVTKDKDFIGICDANRWQHVDDWTAFFVLFPDQALAAALIDSIEVQFHDALNEMVASEFQVMDFVADGVDGVIGDVSQVHADHEGVVIVEAKEDGGTAEIECEIDYWCMVDFQVPDTGYFDEESKTWVDVERDFRMLARKYKAKLEIKFEYDGEDQVVTRLTDVYFPDWEIEVDCHGVERT